MGGVATDRLKDADAVRGVEPDEAVDGEAAVRRFDHQIDLRPVRRRVHDAAMLLDRHLGGRECIAMDGYAPL